MKRYIPLFGLVFIFISSCVNPFVVSCRNAAMAPDKEWKYTKEQAAVACDEAQFYGYPHLAGWNKDKKIWELNPNGVLASDMENVVKDQSESLDQWLSYRNRSEADFVDWMTGFRKGLEREEAITHYILRRLSYVRTYNEFTDIIGELPASMRPGEVSYFFPAGRKFYSMRLLYPLATLEKIPFSAEYLEIAKRDGVLKLVDVFEVASRQEYAQKIPNLYDPNDFQWKKDMRGWIIKSYKVMPDADKPADNIVHYIEVFRKKKDLSGPEDIAAVRGFLAAGGSRVSVFVIDYDQEGRAGYGSPDKVTQSWSEISTGRDIFTDVFLRERILDVLYSQTEGNVEDRPHRKRPQEREIYTSIIKMGDAQINVWETGNWSVPFDYRSLTSGLVLDYLKPKTPEEQRLEERDRVKRIKGLVRYYNSGLKKVIIEYWVPKDQYNERDISDSSANTDTFRIRRRGKQEEVGEINYFGKYRREIDYFYGGRWFKIADENGDGVFEKKRQIADPTGVQTTAPVYPFSFSPF